jgi:hypothetical protein
MSRKDASKYVLAFFGKYGVLSAENVAVTK